MLTMKDIAEKAGVSQATVSRVLSGSSSVLPETRARVMEWVRKLNFEPNQSARALASSRSGLIGLILPDVLNPYFADIIYHIEKIAAYNGFNILFSNSDGDISREQDIIKSMKSRQVEGILIGFASETSPSIEELKQSSLPAVVITQNHPGLDCVSVSHLSGGKQAARMFLDNGIDHFIYQGNKNDDKFRGFSETLEQAGVPEEALDILDLGHLWYNTPQRAYKSASSFIEKGLKKNKYGVFAYNDLSAMGFIHAAQDFQISIPSTLSIIGFDDTFMCQMVRPTLSSVFQPKEEIGRIGIKMLLDKIDGKKKSPEGEHVILEPKLVRRESV